MSRRGTTTLEAVSLLPVALVALLGLVGLAQLGSWWTATQAAATGGARAAAVWLAETPGRAPEAAEAVARGYVALVLGAAGACADTDPTAACAREAWETRRDAAHVEVDLVEDGGEVLVTVRFHPPSPWLLGLVGLADVPISAAAASPIAWRGAR